MPTAAQYQAQLKADTVALTYLQNSYHMVAGLSFVDNVPYDGFWVVGQGTALSPTVMVAFQANPATRGNIAGVMSEPDYAAALAAAQAAVTLDTTMIAAASYTENQLAQAQIFTATQSAALQTLSDVTSNQYLPSYRGYVISVPAQSGGAAFVPDGLDTATPVNSTVGVCERVTPDFMALPAGAEAYFMRNYFAGVPVFFYMLGGTWRTMAQTSGAICSQLVYIQTDATPLITAARAATGAIAFDASPMASIAKYVIGLCADDAAALLAAMQYAAAHTSSAMGAFVSLVEFTAMCAAIVYGGANLATALSSPAASVPSLGTSLVPAADAVPVAASSGFSASLGTVGSTGASLSDQAIASAVAGSAPSIGISAADQAMLDVATGAAQPLTDTALAQTFTASAANVSTSLLQQAQDLYNSLPSIPTNPSQAMQQLLAKLGVPPSLVATASAAALEAIAGAPSAPSAPSAPGASLQPAAVVQVSSQSSSGLLYAALAVGALLLMA